MVIDLLNIPREFTGDPTKWEPVESRLGLRLPTQYKNLVDLMDTPILGDLVVLTPDTENVHVHLIECGERILSADRTSRASWPEHYPFPLHPEPGGLLPWATTGNGDTLYWITREEDPDKWPILATEARRPEFEVWFMSTSQFLHHAFSGKCRSWVVGYLGDSAD